MSSFNNNQMHLSGWHALASSWQDHTMRLPESQNEFRNFQCHGVVVWTNVNNRNDIMTSIALVGGQIMGTFTGSVVVLNDVVNGLSEKKWRNGPNLKQPRSCMGASVCNGYAYIMGGRTDDHVALDTVERIPLSKLFHDQPNENASSWTRLSGRLSSSRIGCAAVTVHDRFIVVIGGLRHFYDILSSVDIIDTRTPAATNHHWNINNNLNNNEHPTVVTVSPGPSLPTPRSHFGATVLDDHIWVVGGHIDNMQHLGTVACLPFGMLQTVNNDTTARSIFSSAWNSRPDLSLVQARSFHGVLAMGQCLVVAGGGSDGRGGLSSVELLDLQRGIVVNLPDMNVGRWDCTMVEIPGLGLLVFGHEVYDDEVYMESHPFVNLSLRQLEKYLQELELWQRPFIPSCGNQISDGQQQTASQVHLRRSQVKSLCHTMVYYYLFHKGGHVSCLHAYTNKK